MLSRIMDRLYAGKPAGTLVLGYGNTLRSDDGVGPRTAEAVAELGFPGVTTFTADLLTPELAEVISRAERVFFIDASVEAPLQVQVRRLDPNPTCQVMAHAADPRTMLALARDVYGYAPEAWWVTIPVEDLGVGEHLSHLALRGMKDALEVFKSHLRRVPG
jgi:hydrogenase maturation protease